MRIKVRIVIEIEDAPEPYPSHLEWEHRTHGGDNPSFYGHEITTAISDAAEQAVASAEVFVVRRPAWLAGRGEGS